MRSTNEVIIAAAGSGKTKWLIDEALADPSRRVLIVTYTRENLREIQSRIWEVGAGGQPHVAVMTWFEFLLREAVKPYQAYKTQILNIRSINFSIRKSATPGLRFARKSDFDQYYVDATGDLYQDVVSDLACAIDDASNGRVVGRIAECFDLILIDEVQDLAGPDLDLLIRLFSSNAKVIAVGDPRQSVYTTNTANKNKQYRRAAIIDWIDEQVAAGRVCKRELSESYRCNQEICDFADALYPDLPKTTSRNNAIVNDGGVCLVHIDDLDAYRTSHAPQELRWDRRVARATASALNMGEVKGMAFDRVLIHPTSTITNNLEKGTDLAEVTRAKFYVAVTRARHSVAIVTESPSTNSGLPFWSPIAH